MSISLLKYIEIFFKNTFSYLISHFLLLDKKAYPMFYHADD